MEIRNIIIGAIVLSINIFSGCSKKETPTQSLETTVIDTAKIDTTSMTDTSTTTQPPGDTDSTIQIILDSSNTKVTFKLGIVPNSNQWTVSGIENAYKLSAEIGEVVALSQDLGWNTDEKIKEYADDVDYARQNCLETFISIDVLNDANRTDISNLPNILAGKNFADNELRQAFKDEVTEIARRYQPAYLSLAIEINGYNINHSNLFINFVSLYGETYDSIKQVSPDTRVTVTFQYDLLKGYNQWDLINLFGTKLDVVCFTTYPDLVFGSLNNLPDNYYSELLSRTGGKPVIFSEIGWWGYATSEGEIEQAKFIVKFFELTKTLNTELAIWTLLHDWDAGGSFASMGLIDNTGRKKPAWYVWNKLRK